LKKLYRILCFLLCCVLSLNGVCLAQAAGQEQQIMSVSPVATQQQRMWCGSNYDTTDWVYEPWGYLGYGKVLYARFLNDSTAGTVHQYVIRFDALAKSNERTLYMAALALSDESALAVETTATAMPTLSCLMEPVILPAAIRVLAASVASTPKTGM